MAIVRVKNKYQVAIPRNVRDQVGIHIGDLLEARAERGKITFSPKSVVDRAIADGLEDIRQGRLHGPFETHEDLIEFLHGQVRKAKKKAARKR